MCDINTEVKKDDIEMHANRAGPEILGARGEF
jgi:hypothetical protein